MGIIRVVSDIHIKDGTEETVLKELGKNTDKAADFIAHTLLSDISDRVRALGVASHAHDASNTTGCSECSRSSGVAFIRRS